MVKLYSARTVLAIALASGGVSLLSGCGAGQAGADRDVQTQVDAADLARSKATNDDQLAAVQATYDKLAAQPVSNTATGISGISPALHVLIRGKQTQFRLERVSQMMSDLRTLETGISRDVSRIEQMSSQVASAQTSIDSLKAYDPTTQIAALKAQQKAIAGSADQLTWTPPSAKAGDTSDQVQMPTIAALDAQISALNQKIAKNSQDTDAAHQLSTSKNDEAEKLTRQSEGEAGDARMADITKTAQARKDASNADAAAFALKNQLSQLNADLKNFQDQKSAMQATSAALDSQADALQKRWDAIQEQITAQQAFEKQIAAGGGPESKPDDDTIASRAQSLAQQMGDANHLREKIEQDLNSVVTQLGDAVTSANLIRTSMMTDIREKPEDPDQAVWKQMQETLHPTHYLLQKAQAMQWHASVEASKLAIDQQVAQMFDGFSVKGTTGVVKVPGLTALFDHDRTGLDLPKALSDISHVDADTLKGNAGDVQKLYEAAEGVYANLGASTDQGPSATMRQNEALLAEAALDREYAQFDQSIGDAAGAKEHLSSAQEKDGQVDPSFRAMVTATVAPPKPTTPAADSAVGG